MSDPLDLGQAEGGQRARNVTDDLDPVRLEVEGLRGDDRADHHDQRTRDSWCEPLEQKQRDERRGPDRHGGSVGVAQVAPDVEHGVVEVLAARDRDAEDVLGLREPDDQRSSGREPDQHRVREEVDHVAEATDAEDDVDDTDHQRQQRGGLEVARGALLDDGSECRGGQQRDDGDRSDGELPRRPEQRVDDDGNGGGVEADLGRKPCQQRVGHRLGNQHRSDGHAGSEIAPEIAALVVRGPRHDRQDLLEAVHNDRIYVHLVSNATPPPSAALRGAADQSGKRYAVAAGLSGRAYQSGRRSPLSSVPAGRVLVSQSR